MAVITPEQRAFLEQQRIARLATVDERGRPHVLPVCFALLGAVLYTPIDEKPKRAGSGSLRRVRNITANPNVCLVIDVYDEDWTQLAWLQVRGRASLVTVEQERSAALLALRERYTQYRTMDLETRLLIGITPERLVGWTARGAYETR